jgi:hypothetical protein
MTDGAKSPPKNKLSPPWKPGQSGNPKGRPKGSRNRVSVACDELLDGEAEKLTRKVIDLAHEGDIKRCLSWDKTDSSIIQFQDDARIWFHR